MARIEGIDPQEADPGSQAAFGAQSESWGAPLVAHLLYARRPTIYRGARAMWSGLDQSGLLDPALVTLVNRRVATINGCVF
jgi:alkylhydroperoxidase family enzyme